MKKLRCTEQWKLVHTISGCMTDYEWQLKEPQADDFTDMSWCTPHQRLSCDMSQSSMTGTPDVLWLPSHKTFIMLLMFHDLYVFLILSKWAEWSLPLYVMNLTVGLKSRPLILVEQGGNAKPNSCNAKIILSIICQFFM